MKYFMWNMSTISSTKDFWQNFTIDGRVAIFKSGADKRILNQSIAQFIVILKILYSANCINMATEDKEVQNADTNVNNSVEQPDTDTAEYLDQMNSISGWLMKRTKLTHKWKNTYFTLKDTNLLYGNSENVRKAKRQSQLTA